MKQTELLFLEALKASLTNTTVTWSSADVSPAEITQIFKLAETHSVQPMIFQAVYSCDAVKKADPKLIEPHKQQIMRYIALQTMKSSEFEDLYQHLQKNGLKPCVVKGIICRNTYPDPDARMSSDEDIWIPEDQYSIAHKAMLDYGMLPAEQGMDVFKEFEVPYFKPGSLLYIELHKNLFPPTSEAYGDMNQFFEKSQERMVTEKISRTTFYSLEPTDHLTYLICHSFKHFLHGGFGLRQVCDIIMYANTYGHAIDWHAVLEHCREIRGELFAASMFVIGEKYLTFDSEKACYPAEWSEIQVDASAMLEDLLDSGTFGASEMSRKHSSNITLSALVADKRGEKTKSGLVGSVFLPAKSLSNRYKYLERFPWLLPVAWVQRVFGFLKKNKGKKSASMASRTIEIGNQRVELMRKYGIIK